jgi:hypothetical protein
MRIIVCGRCATVLFNNFLGFAMFNTGAFATVTCDGVTENVGIQYLPSDAELVREIEALRATLRADYDDEVRAEEKYVIVLW